MYMLSIHTCVLKHWDFVSVGSSDVIEEGSSTSPPVLPATATVAVRRLGLETGSQKVCPGEEEEDCRKKLVLFTKTFALCGGGGGGGGGVGAGILPLSVGGYKKGKKKSGGKSLGAGEHERTGIV